jgi:YidC/Oxa1 family membrane protein insertase
MEEKKFDLNSAIGFVLLGAIMLWYLYSNQPTPEELQEKEAKQEQVEEETKPTPASSISEPVLNNFGTDSLALSNAQSVLGVFGYGATLPSVKEGTTTLENDLVRIEVANLGGQITEVELKNLSLIHI